MPEWAFGGFVRPVGANPIISPDSNSRFFDPMNNIATGWEANDTFNPGAAVIMGKIVLLYRSEDRSGIKISTRTSRLGYAISKDGIHFKRKKEPVFYPQDDSQKEYEWPGGCEDPRIAKSEDGRYVMLYTQWNRKVPRLGVATSTDLLRWTKHGPIFKSAYAGKFHNIATKSASILTRIEGDQQLITKINGQYFMYWGERNVYGATSTDLLNWTPLVDQQGKLSILASPRRGFFDSNMTECGPPAILTPNGIVLFYNGRNNPGIQGDQRFSAKSYSAGQMLFDKSDPTKLVDRLDVPFLRPMEPFEKSGQYVDGTVFIEGMAWFKNKWYLYYGCADSRVGVAIYDPIKPAFADPITDSRP
ncbi:glycoside hydrolase family 130 protein [Pedobacter mucosus]|uniref:glycoside hydrolase family 130 protein n=1 Tax=Pedobacter mucosus TaxID=2895286 RepID=UPI001EE3D0FE|nr:glycoside hydrolase family 130 protein [Pedobacter mucosus]UKT65935.1 glycoside hydrolase family 130 protein [Pedobacter mucosus]